MEPQCTVIPPRRLKDFLQDQNLPFPRSRRSSISVFLHAAVSSVKSTSILRRTISRRFSAKHRSTSRLPDPTMNRTTSVTVKDILRWKSFRDLADQTEINNINNNNINEIDVSPVTDFTPPESPRCTATTTSVGTPMSSSSWCDSDFTVGDSPVSFRGFSGESDVGDKKSFHINIAGGDKKKSDPKDRIILVEEEEQQFSPISVLDFTQEHEGTFSPFHQILEDMERRNSMLKQRIRDFENLIEVDDDKNKHVELNDIESFVTEENAIRLMEHVKTTSSIEEWDLNLECLLLDYFRDELITSKEVKNNGELEYRVINVAKSWVRGEMEGRREVCIREMEKGSCSWKDFEDEENEIVIEIEKMMLNQLLDELSIDLVNI